MPDFPRISSAADWVDNKITPKVAYPSILGKHIFTAQKLQATSKYKVVKYGLIPLVFAVTLPVFAVLGLLGTGAKVAFRAVRGKATKEDLKHLIAHITVIITLPFVLVSFMRGKYGAKALDLKNKAGGEDTHPLIHMLYQAKTAKNADDKAFIEALIKPVLTKESIGYISKTTSLNDNEKELFKTIKDHNDLDVQLILETIEKDKDANIKINLSPLLKAAMKNNKTSLLRTLIKQDNLNIYHDKAYLDFDNLIKQSLDKAVKDENSELIDILLYSERISLANRPSFFKEIIAKRAKEKAIEIDDKLNELSKVMGNYTRDETIALLINEAIKTCDLEYVERLINKYPNLVVYSHLAEAVSIFMVKNEEATIESLNDSANLTEIMYLLVEKISDVKDFYILEKVLVANKLPSILIKKLIDKGANVNEPFSVNFNIDNGIPLEGIYGGLLKPLIFAILSGNPETVAILLQHGAFQEDYRLNGKYQTPAEVIDYLIKNIGLDDEIKGTKENYERIREMLKAPSIYRADQSNQKEEIVDNNPNATKVINLASYHIKNIPINEAELSNILQSAQQAENSKKPWELFGLEPLFTPSQLIKAYQHVILTFHPDKSNGEIERGKVYTEIFKIVKGVKDKCNYFAKR